MGQGREVREAVKAMGNQLSPNVLARVQSLFRDEIVTRYGEAPASGSDLAYGGHERQRLDIYHADPVKPAPILVWLHGGGFLRGEKRSPDHPFNAHVGRLAAREGMLGVVINYRLAPGSVWPSGVEDIAAVIVWLRANARSYGGDPDRIVLAGTSAGAAHIADYIKASLGAEGISGAVLLSGLYGVTPLEDRDKLYYSSPAQRDVSQAPVHALVATSLPLFVACAEFDPPRFQAEAAGLLAQRLEVAGAFPRAHIASGHNHFSIACHLGGADLRLTDEILAFIAECVQRS